jgi:hypothetical protein
MKFSLALLATVTVIAFNTPQSVRAVCCLSGTICGRHELGHTYAADAFIPADLHERDIVLPSVADLNERAGCCCQAPNAQACKDICF